MQSNPQLFQGSNLDSDQPVVIITGQSGAGLSTAIRVLQDAGYYCIDNLPIEMLWDALSVVGSGKVAARGFAFGMDIRDASFATKFPQLKVSLAEKAPLDVLFLTADEETLFRRYSATRRRHPLLEAGCGLADAIKREQLLLAPVESSADAVIDTSHLTSQVLARMIEDRYANKGVILRSLFVTITSFGFKNGALSPADSIQDVRFLNNPFFVPELKLKTGLDKDVRDYVMSDPVSNETFSKFNDLYRYLLPYYLKEGKHYFRIGIGCTGGQHRSVTFVEELARTFAASPLTGIQIAVAHRDLGE